MIFFNKQSLTMIIFCLCTLVFTQQVDAKDNPLPKADFSKMDHRGVSTFSIPPLSDNMEETLSRLSRSDRPEDKRLLELYQNIEVIFQMKGKLYDNMEDELSRLFRNLVGVGAQKIRKLRENPIEEEMKNSDS